MLYVWNTKYSDRHAKLVGASKILPKCYQWSTENEKQKYGLSSLEDRDTGLLPFRNGDHEMFGARERSDYFSCQKNGTCEEKKRTKLLLGYIDLETHVLALQYLTQKPSIQIKNVWLFHPEFTIITVSFQLVISGEEISPDNMIRPNQYRCQALGTY